MTIFEQMRHRLHERAGLIDPPENHLNIEALYDSEWSSEFEQLMRNRLVMGALRYGRIRKHGGGKRGYNRLAGARKRLSQYEQTGNLECLVDAANMLLLEYVEGDHPNRHMDAIHGDHCHHLTP